MSGGGAFTQSPGDTPHIVAVQFAPSKKGNFHSAIVISGNAKDKKLTMENYWVPGVNSTGKFGRWAFAEFTEVFGMEANFAARIESEFRKVVDSVSRRKLHR